MGAPIAQDIGRPPMSSPPGQSLLRRTDPEELHDLICVGFGPASLAVAVALHDLLSLNPVAGVLPETPRKPPKVAFLERQPKFAWHAGMLLPGATMQISFIKDLATLRNPKSEFTFLNYLHHRRRLVHFSNLGTFLPLRLEYEDYLRWCASWFNDVVSYGQEVLDVTPEASSSDAGPTNSFVVRSKPCSGGNITSYRARHVVIAVGGRPEVPKSLGQGHPRVIHSSSYARVVPMLLKQKDRSSHIGVVGSGQSAAEIFHDLHSNYPNAKTTLFIRGSALRPSDDSPFVNEIFNPKHVDDVYAQSPEVREAELTKDRGTNYGVVRLELLERIYGTIYKQRIRNEDETTWQHRILPFRTVTHVEDLPDSERVRLHVRNDSHIYGERNGLTKESLEVDVLVAATGYIRDAHETMLRPAESLRRDNENKWRVARDYRVVFKPGAVSDDAGVWLQGCNESTHGLSDTLLSILANRGGELVESIFGRS